MPSWPLLLGQIQYGGKGTISSSHYKSRLMTHVEDVGFHSRTKICRRQPAKCYYVKATEAGERRTKKLPHPWECITIADSTSEPISEDQHAHVL